MTRRPNRPIRQTFPPTDLARPCRDSNATPPGRVRLKRQRLRSNGSTGNESATADPGTRLPGVMASGASRKRANVSRTAAEPILVAGKHRVELHREGFVPADATSPSACRGMRRKRRHAFEARRAPRHGRDPAEIIRNLRCGVLAFHNGSAASLWTDISDLTSADCPRLLLALPPHARRGRVEGVHLRQRPDRRPTLRRPVALCASWETVVDTSIAPGLRETGRETQTRR